MPPVSSPAPSQPMGFWGTHALILDDEGYLTLPESLPPADFILTQGMDGCVLLAPRDYFAGLQAKIHQLPLTRRNARALRRHLFAHATTAAPDAQRRIWVPPQLRAFAQLDHQVVLVGNDAYLELWNPDLWDQVRRDMETQQQDEDWLIPGI